MKTVLMKSVFLCSKRATQSDFSSPKGYSRLQKGRYKRVGKKRLTFLYTFISSALEIEQVQIFINTLFINPGIYTVQLYNLTCVFNSLNCYM